MIHTEAWYQESGREQDIAALERTLRTDPHNAEVMAQLMVTLHRYGMLSAWLEKHLFSSLHDAHFNDFPGLWEFVKSAPTESLPKEVWVEVYRMFRNSPGHGFLNYAWDFWFKRSLADVLGGFYPDLKWRELLSIGALGSRITGFVYATVVNSDGTSSSNKYGLVPLILALANYANSGEDDYLLMDDDGNPRLIIDDPPKGEPQIRQWVKEARISA